MKALPNLHKISQMSIISSVEMEVTATIRLMGICLQKCIKEMRQFERIPSFRRDAFPAINERIAALCLYTNDLSTRFTEDNAVEESARLGQVFIGLLDTVEVMCAAITGMESTKSEFGLYLRKAELLAFDGTLAEVIADNPGQFLPVQSIATGFQAPPLSATLVSTESNLSNALQLTGICYIGSAPMPTLHSALRTSVKVVKEMDLVSITEGPGTAPVARWQLQPGQDYPIRSGLLLNLGTAVIAVHRVTSKFMQLRWKVGEEGYTPLRQLTADEQEEWIVGRHQNCDLLINDRRVSSRHARVWKGGGGWFISDLHSSNGTYQYLHSLYTLNADSEEFLVRSEGRVLLAERDISLQVTLVPLRP